MWSYGASYLVGAGIQLLALPFILLTCREKAPADMIATERGHLARKQRAGRSRSQEKMNKSVFPLRGKDGLICQLE